jgi:hypothetical protein
VFILGKQECIYGIDEDRCDELEYNECEENEYRCQDGSCIPEEYWLDGQFDCADKSDEQTMDKYYVTYFCSLTSSQFECDEATANYEYFACGDGEFVQDNITCVQKVLAQNVHPFFGHLETTIASQNQSVRIRI